MRDKVDVMRRIVCALALALATSTSARAQMGDFIDGNKLTYVLPPDITYPAEARLQYQQGTVVLAVTVDANGHPANVQVFQSSGYGLLDAEAMRSMMNATFPSPLKVGRYRIPINFVLTHTAQAQAAPAAPPNAQAQSKCAPFQRILNAAVAARTDVTSQANLTYLSLGVNPSAGTIAEAAARFLTKVRGMAYSTPESMLGPALYQPYGLGQAGLSLTDVYHLKNYSDPQMKAIADMIVKCEP
jgi:TonB family protein